MTSQLRKVRRIEAGPNRVFFEKEMKHIIRRPDVTKAVLIWSEAGGNTGTLYLKDMGISEFCGMVERAKLERFYRAIK